jgi:hypothetical protein
MGRRLVSLVKNNKLWEKLGEEDQADLEKITSDLDNKIIARLGKTFDLDRLVAVINEVFAEGSGAEPVPPTPPVKSVGRAALIEEMLEEERLAEEAARRSMQEAVRESEDNEVVQNGPPAAAVEEDLLTEPPEVPVEPEPEVPVEKVERKNNRKNGRERQEPSGERVSFVGGLVAKLRAGRGNRGEPEEREVRRSRREVEAQEEDPEGQFEGDRETVKKTFPVKFILIAIGLIILLGALGIGGAMYMSGGGSEFMPTGIAGPTTGTEEVPDTSGRREVPETAITGPTFWQGLENQELPPERSPMRKGFLDANSIASFIFVIALAVWVWLEYKEREGSHQGVKWLALATIILAIIMVPLINAAAANSNILVGFLIFLLLIILSLGPIASIIAHNDKTHLAVLLSIWAFMLFVIGHFDLPVFIGRLAGKTWEPWAGVYGFGGWITLIATLNFKAIILTTIIGVLSMASIWVGTTEAGKRMGTGAYIVGVLMVIFWIVIQWGTGQALIWTVEQGATQSLVLALEIARPIISWLLSVIVALILGFVFGDREMVIGERQVKLGIKKERAVATFVDFLIFATIIALTGMVMSS